MAQKLVTGLIQVCIVSNNFERTVRSLAETFGIGPWKCWDYSPPKILDTRYSGDPADWTMKLGIAWVGDIQLEVIQPTGGVTIYQDYIDRHGEGVQHLLVQTGPGYFDAITAFEAAGYATIQGARINPPMMVGPVSLPPLPGFLAGNFAVQFVYHGTESALGVTLETSKMPPGISFRLGVKLGKPDFVIEAARAAAPITEIQRVGILTEDLEGSVRAWEALGVEPWSEIDADGARIMSAPLSAATIDLVQPAGEGLYRDLLTRHGPGVRYLGVAGSVKRALEAAGCGLLAENERGAFLDATGPAHTVLLV